MSDLPAIRMRYLTEEDLSGRIEFISYDGKFPKLCQGILKLKVDGEMVEFPQGSLVSGGKCRNLDPPEIDAWFIGKWPADFPEELKYEVPIYVNNRIPFGCCGGCQGLRHHKSGSQTLRGVHHCHPGVAQLPRRVHDADGQFHYHGHRLYRDFRLVFCAGRRSIETG